MELPPCEYRVPVRTNYSIVFLGSVIIMLVASIVATLTHIDVVDNISAMESAFLHTAGGLGVVGFASMLIWYLRFTSKTRNVRSVPLLLDGAALHYGKLNVSWNFMREAVACKVLGKSFIGIRTLNDRAVIAKIDQVYQQAAVHSAARAGIRFHLWRTQCSILIPAPEYVGIDEVIATIERYRNAANAHSSESAAQR